MDYTNNNSNMYCSDDDGYDAYSSEHPYEANLSEDEYDSDFGYYDDRGSNSNEAFLVSIFKTARQIFIIFGQKLDFNV